MNLPELDGIVWGSGTGAFREGSYDGRQFILEAVKNGRVAARATVGHLWGQVIAADLAQQDLADEAVAPKAAGAVLDQYRTLLRDVRSPALYPAGPQYAGGQSCRSCHEVEWEQWSKSRHGHALDTLRSTSDEWNWDCPRCHTVGFNVGNGYRVGADDRFAGVQCESCHGPSTEHARTAKVTTPGPASNSCILCHTEEASPHFDQTKYWRMVEHGSRSSQTR